MSRFFAYSRDGFTFHATAAEAKAEAERMLDIERDFATRESEWSEDATEIMWGEIRGRVEERCVDPNEDDGWHIKIKLEDIK